MARLRNAPSAQTAPAETKTTRQALKEKTNTTLPKVPVYKNDGNVDELVKPARPRRGNRRNAARDEGDLLMAGGLGNAETGRQTLLPTEHPTTTNELAKSDERPPPPTAKANKRPPRMTRKAVQNEAKSEVLQDVKRRMLADTGKPTATKKVAASQSTVRSIATQEAAAKPSISQNATAANHERSEFSLSPSPSPPRNGSLSAIKDKRTSIAYNESPKKAQSTPSAESSILALKNFKRRPRQPSILQMVQQRTASARPSAVNSQAREDSNVYDLLDEIVDDDAFAPDAEGTPARLRARPRLSAARYQSAFSDKVSHATHSSALKTNKRKSNEADLSSSILHTQKAKRQKSTSVQRPDDSDVALLTSEPDNASQPNVSGGALLTSAPARSSSSTRRNNPQQQITTDVQVISSGISTPPPTDSPSDGGRAHSDNNVAILRTAEERLSDIDHLDQNAVDDDEDQDVANGTMAEPVSSSPLHSPNPEKFDQVLRPTRPEKMNKKKTKPLTTETLQSLLPKRRQAPKRTTKVLEYDIASDSDQDNESGEAARGIQSRRQTKTVQSKGRKVLTAAKNKSRQSKAVPPTRKSSARPPATKKPSKTYGRESATTSDKENEGDYDAYESLDGNDESALPDTSLSMYEAAHSKELEAARKKFAEVDDWDMEFESMSIEEGRSSSQEWR